MVVAPKTRRTARTFMVGQAVMVWVRWAALYKVVTPLEIQVVMSEKRGYP
jgi:hypothetical protein